VTLRRAQRYATNTPIAAAFMWFYTKWRRHGFVLKKKTSPLELHDTPLFGENRTYRSSALPEYGSSLHFHTFWSRSMSSLHGFSSSEYELMFDSTETITDSWENGLIFSFLGKFGSIFDVFDSFFGNFGKIYKEFRLQFGQDHCRPCFVQFLQ
jgi:hypothetical protein